MEEFDHEKYKVSLKGEQTEAGQACYVIEAYPLESGIKSVYEKKIIWLRKDILFIIRMDYFKKGDKDPCKLLNLTDIQNVDGHYVAKTMIMSDLKKGSKTTVNLKGIAFDKPQPASRFTLQNLNREGGE
jgi:hypothetical protein